MPTDAPYNPDSSEALIPLDKPRFEALYREYWRPLYDFVLRKTHDPDVAEEVVQDLFVHLWEKRGQLTISHLRSYLFIAARNRVIDFYQQRLFAPLDAASQEAAPDYPMFLDELETTLQEAVAQLPDKTREIFILNRLEGRTASEISSILGIPQRTVEYHITQSLRHLRVLLRSGISFIMLLLS